MKIERNNIFTEKGLLEWVLVNAVNIEDLEKQLTKYKSSYMKANPHADWNKETKRVLKWYDEREKLMIELKGDTLSFESKR